ncbi:KR domain-containing protein [Streptomyces sp. GKU 257-1]|nr:KR domain-containing protein [Streptomyces sp. GKU 257-1]
MEPAPAPGTVVFLGEAPAGLAAAAAPAEVVTPSSGRTRRRTGRTAGPRDRAAHPGADPARPRRPGGRAGRRLPPGKGDGGGLGRRTPGERPLAVPVRQRRRPPRTPRRHGRLRPLAGLGASGPGDARHRPRGSGPRGRAERRADPGRARRGPGGARGAAGPPRLGARRTPGGSRGAHRRSGRPPGHRRHRCSRTGLRRPAGRTGPGRHRAAGRPDRARGRGTGPAARHRRRRPVRRRADLATRDGVRSAVEQAREAGELVGVAHLAGTLHDSFLLRKSRAEADAVLRPKVLGAAWLDQATRHDPLRYFLAYSSTAAAFGNVGQADHATASGYLDRLAAPAAPHVRRPVSGPESEPVGAVAAVDRRRSGCRARRHQRDGRPVRHAPRPHRTRDGGPGAGPGRCGAVGPAGARRRRPDRHRPRRHRGAALRGGAPGSRGARPLGGPCRLRGDGDDRGRRSPRPGPASCGRGPARSSPGCWPSSCGCPRTTSIRRRTSTATGSTR